MHRQIMRLRAVFWLLFLKVGLRLFSFPRMRSLLRHWIPATVQHPNSDEDKLKQIIWAIESASYHIPLNFTCFPRALTAQLMMKRSGYPVDLRLGIIRMPDKKMEAHAWIEYQDKVLIGDLPNLSQYTPLDNVDIIAN